MQLSLWFSSVLWLKISLKSNYCVSQDWSPVAACLMGVAGAGLVAYRHIHTVVGGVQLFMGCWNEHLSSLVPAGWRLPSVLCIVSFPMGQPIAHSMAVGFIRVNKKKIRESKTSVMDLVSEVTFHHICYILPL